MNALRAVGLCLLALTLCACSSGQVEPETDAPPPVPNVAPPTTPPAAPSAAPGTVARNEAPPAARLSPPPGPPPPRRIVTDEELQPLLDAVADDLDDVGAQQRLATTLWDGGRYDEALNHFERAVQIDPSDPRSLLNLGLAYTTLGRLDEADAVYQRLLGVPEVRHVALRNLGNVAVKKNNLPAAISFYRQAIEAKPDFMEAYYRLGVVLEQTGEFREAYMTYGKLLELEPREDPNVLAEYVDALFRMAKLDLRMGATERAAQMLAEVVAAVPEHPEAHQVYGQALQALGRSEEAQEAFQTHEKLNSGS